MINSVRSPSRVPKITKGRADPPGDGRASATGVLVTVMGVLVTVKFIKYSMSSPSGRYLGSPDTNLS